MRSGSSRLRAVALLGAAAIALHELRYGFAFADGVERTLAERGHAYLSLVLALVGLIAIAAIAGLLIEIARARRGQAHPASSPSLGRRWLSASAALAALHLSQEALERYPSGHGSGMDGLLGHGLWLVPLLAIALGLVVAALLSGADAAIRLVQGRAALPHPSRPGRGVFKPPLATWPTPDPLASHLASRGPPLAAC